jgi:hypothetical protein
MARSVQSELEGFLQDSAQTLVSRKIDLRDTKNRSRGGVTDRQPDHFRSSALEEAQLTKVVILRYDYEAMIAGKLPNC